MVEDGLIIRRLLWLNHGCSGLYGDDGEMQCSKCMIDFVRDSAADIDTRFLERGLQKIKEF